MPTVPANRRSINQDTFSWTVPGTRKKINIRAAGFLTLGESRELQEAAKTKTGNGVQLLLDLAKTEADRAALLALPLVYVKELSAAWNADAKVSLGKS